jgi:hypothetical protein
MKVLEHLKRLLGMCQKEIRVGAVGEDSLRVYAKQQSLDHLNSGSSLTYNLSGSRPL